jgi:hypothetical protein
MKTKRNLPWDSIPIPIPTPTPAGSESKQIAHHCLEATRDGAPQARV